MTTGYREGLSVGKARVMQSAFDQGYPLGVSLALRVGAVLGTLEGLLATASVRADEKRTKVVEGMLARARGELDVKNLLEGVEEEVIAEVESLDGLTEIEERVKVWEEMVLKGLEERARNDKGDEARPEDHTIKNLEHG